MRTAVDRGRRRRGPGAAASSGTRSRPSSPSPRSTRSRTRRRAHFPTASSRVGHGIGIAGFVLMLMTATLYSLRKLRTDASWGSTASWLRFHMVTGLVGPYMVLLHTAMRFHGLAGLTMLLTVLVVASGLVGRFLYTRVPRIAGGRRRGGAPSPPGTWSTCRSPGRCSPPRSSTSSRPSTTRRCSGDEGGDGDDHEAPRIRLGHGHRGGRRRLARRRRRDRTSPAPGSSAPAR